MTGNGGANSSKKANSSNEDHHKLYQLVFVIAGTIVTAVIEFALLWSDNRHLAFLALAASLSLLSIYQTRIWGWDVNWIIAVVFFWFALGQIANGIIGPIPPARDVEVTGRLQPASDPMLRTGCDPATADNGKDNPYWQIGILRMGAGERPKEPPPKGAVVVALGSNGIIVTKDEKVPIIKLDECVLLAIQRTPSGLLVDASVYDVDGKVLARIDNNAFQGLEGENSQTRREGDLSTLIVRHQQAERLWVHYANKAAIQIRGTFMCPHASRAGIAVGKDSVQMFAGNGWPFPTRVGNLCLTDKPLPLGPLP